MKRALFVPIIVSMLCINIALNAASITPTSNTKENTIQTNKSSTAKTVETIAEALNKISVTNEKNNEKTNIDPQPVLGDDEIFGLWVCIVYNGNEFRKKIDITPWMIRGKLTDPKYRTPIKFNVDDDPEDDIETGFGFFRYGIQEITEDGNIDHSAWATAFDFTQIKNGLDNQLGELEVWQEFHVNLDILKKSKNADQPSTTTSIPKSQPLTQSHNDKHETNPLELLLTKILNRIKQKFKQLTTLQYIIEKILNHISNKNTQNKPNGDTYTRPTAAPENYIITRVGFRSPPGEKIPIVCEKTFAIAKDWIFRPIIFQHEMNPHDIIGTASNDFMFGFLAYQQGNVDPSYNIEFSMTLEPAVYSVTQFTPRSGKVFYYYHSASDEETNITFSSNLLKGGDGNEEEEGSFSLTLTLDSVDQELVGLGKWMCFDVDVIGDSEPIGGKITYTASHEFNVGITVSSPRFEENVLIKGIPKSAALSWDVDVDINTQNFFRADVSGYIELDMSDQLDEISIYYPKSQPNDPDLIFFNIMSIPSRERIGAEATLNVDLQDITNPGNYIYGRVYRDFSANIESIGLYLPDIDIPLVEITDIPSYSAAKGQLWWNRLQGYARAERWSSGPPDPFHFNLVFDNFTLTNVLEIRDGYIQGDFKIAEDGYLGFDTGDNMFGNVLQVSDATTGNGLSISVDEIAADNLWLDWRLNTSGEQLAVEQVGFNGFLDTFKNFAVTLNLQGKTGHFNGGWTLGKSGSLDIAFYQEEPITLEFDMDNYSADFDLHGHVILSNLLQFDMSWQWKQGESLQDPGFFKINENHNEPNLQEIEMYFTYQDQYGVDVILTDGGIYMSLEWWRGSTLLPITWLVLQINGDLDIHLLWNGEWYYNIEDE